MNKKEGRGRKREQIICKDDQARMCGERKSKAIRVVCKCECECECEAYFIIRSLSQLPGFRCWDCAMEESGSEDRILIGRWLQSRPVEKDRGSKERLLV